MPKGERVQDRGLPLWPQVYITKRGVVTVTGRHCSIPRYRLIGFCLNLLRASGIIASLILGLSLIAKTDANFNRVQIYRLQIDHSIIDGLIQLNRDWFIHYRDYLMTDQNFSRPRLRGEVWASFGVIWFLLFAVLKSINRTLLAGWLFAQRSTIKISPTQIVLYRLRLFPRRFDRDQVSTLQFKVEQHPRLKRKGIDGLARDVQMLYHDSGQVVMVYGARVEPIAIIVGAAAAGQFAVCCDSAAGRSKKAAATIEKVRIRVELE